jgi:hypothetical protein
MSKAGEHQPDPIGKGKIVLDYVIADLEERAQFGHKKYGTYLRTNNGRDALIDAYQEALDLVMYLKQIILEKEDDGK